MSKIKIENLYKYFDIGFRRRETFLNRILSILSGVEDKKHVCVLNDISLDINSGEVVGLIGKNGSGKSTLLRILSKIYVPDKGNMFVRGKVISLIGLGNGFLNRLSMRENIFIVGSLFGISKSEIEVKFNEIVEFADLKDYVDTKLYQFSSGMLQRLAFSIAINCNPDILLLDEVFEVGDESFKKKSASKIRGLVDKGCLVILVSHDLDLIEKYCDKVIVLDKGKIAFSGDVYSAIKRYRSL